MNKRIALLAPICLWYALLVLQIIIPAVEAQSIEITVTNTTAVFVRFHEVKIYNFTHTRIRIGYIDVNILRLVYVCIYMYNYTNECKKVSIYIYNDTVLVEKIHFTNLTKMCSIEGLCNGYHDINVTGFSKIIYEIYDNETGELLARDEIPKYEFVTMLKGYLSWLKYLIPIGLLIGLAGRGSMKSIGLGLICFSVAIVLIPYLGFVPPYAYILFTLGIVLGLILLFFASR